MPIISYKYGALWPADWDADCERHIELQVDLWNNLATIHAEASEAIRELTPVTSGLTEAANLLDDLKIEYRSLTEQIRCWRLSRTTVNVNDDQQKAGEAIKEAKTRLAEVRALIRKSTQHRRELAREARAALVPNEIRCIYNLQQARIKEARNNAARNGLWWGNYNAVISSFDETKTRIIKHGGVIRKKEFDGTGRLTVPLQGGATPMDLFDRGASGKYKEACLVSGPPPGWCDKRFIKKQTLPSSESKRAKRNQLVTLAMTVYTERTSGAGMFRRMLNVPIIYDRPIPQNARIQRVILSRRRGRRFPTGDWRYEVIFIVRVPDQVAPTTNRHAAIHIGWRQVEGGIRVATVADPDKVTHFILPVSLVGRFERASQELARLDRIADNMRATVLSWPSESIPLSLDLLLKGLRELKSGEGIASALRRLMREWQIIITEGSSQYIEMLQHWSNVDIRGRWGARNISSKAVRCRNDMIRAWVAHLARSYDRVIVQQYNISRLRKRSSSDALFPLSRRNIQIAAPGTVRSCLISTMVRRGVVVIEHKGKVTWICHKCHHENAPSDPRSYHHRCSYCECVWDIDDNAAINALDTLISKPGTIGNNGAQISSAVGAYGQNGANESGRYTRSRKDRSQI